MKDVNPTRHATLLRGAGLVFILIGFMTFDENATTTVHTLWLPLLMATGAALSLQNILAVALAITALAGIHADPGATDWVTARAYPVLALIGSIVIVTILIKRFRRTIHATRAARRAEREARRNP